MDQVIEQVATKLGIPQEQAQYIVEMLHGQGHDVQNLLQNDGLIEKAKEFMNGSAKELLGQVPGLGGLLGDGHQDPSAEVKAPME